MGVEHGYEKYEAGRCTFNWENNTSMMSAHGARYPDTCISMCVCARVCVYSSLEARHNRRLYSTHKFSSISVCVYI